MVTYIFIKDRSILLLLLFYFFHIVLGQFIFSATGVGISKKAYIVAMIPGSRRDVLDNCIHRLFAAVGLNLECQLKSTDNSFIHSFIHSFMYYINKADTTHLHTQTHTQTHYTH